MVASARQHTAAAINGPKAFVLLVIPVLVVHIGTMSEPQRETQKYPKYQLDPTAAAE